MSYNRVAAVTGANKGIGLAIVRNLALQYPKSSFNNGPFLIYLTARDKGRGEAAVTSLHNDDQLKRAGVLAQDGGLTTIKYHPLDISDTMNIRQFADFVKKEHPEGIDFVVNNAGVALDGFDENVVKQTLQCNYYGTLTSTQLLLPLIRPNGRLVNVSSMMGSLSKYPSSIASRFRNAQSVDDITSLMQAFQSSVANGTYKKDGWPSSAYSVSKAGVTGMTRVIAREEKGKGRGVLVNACCPGYVNTDMTKGRGSKTPDQGARTPVMLALEDIGDVSGEYWQNEKVKEW